METQLGNINTKLSALHQKRKRVDDQIAEVEKIQKKMSNLWESPIFKICIVHFIEDVAVVIFDYLNLEYCHKHQTHFPKHIVQCLGCMETPTYPNRFICEIGPLNKKTTPEGVTIIDFHENDMDVKHHLKSLLRDECLFLGHISKKLFLWSTQKLKSKKLGLYLAGNTDEKKMQIIVLSLNIDKTEGTRDLFFDLP